MRHAPALLLALLVPLAAACGAGSPRPPGYSGSIASIEARSLLADLSGRTFEDTTGALGGGTITVGPFAVVPNPRTGKGPVVQVQGPDGTDWLPMHTDGDVADLWMRVHGTAPDDVSGTLSAAYRDVWRAAAGGE